MFQWQSCFLLQGCHDEEKEIFNLDGSKATSHADISADTVKGGNPRIEVNLNL